MQWHQKIALVNLGLMSYQYYLGKKMDEDPATYNQKYKTIHKNLGYTTFSVYITAAGLSLFSPPALKYNQGITSMNVHRFLSIIHFTGMIAQPWLGYKANNSSDYNHYIDLHKGVGNIVFISYLLSFILTLFPS